MKNKFLKSLISTILAIFFITNSVFATSVSIEVGSDNKSKITIKDITKPIYSLQLELTDNNGNKGYTFSPNQKYFYNSILETTTDGKTNLILLIDETNSYLINSGDLLVGALSSTSKPNFDTKAKLILVDSNLESFTEDVTVNVTYKESSSGTGSSGGSGGSATITTTTPQEENSSEEASLEEGSSDEETSTDEAKTEETTQTVQNELSISTIKLPEIKEEANIEFNDISDFSWAKSSIEKLTKAGIINGDGQGAFNPSGNSKRADVVIMLTKLLGLENSTLYIENFNDVSSDKYYAKYVGIARQYGLVNGSNGNFNPENNITRQDTMVMVANILKQLGLSLNTDTETLQKFNDFENISDYAKESVAILVNLGIINGSNGEINPKGDITRAEMSIVISKLYDLLEEQISSQDKLQETEEEQTSQEDDLEETDEAEINSEE